MVGLPQLGSLGAATAGTSGIGAPSPFSSNYQSLQTSGPGQGQGQFGVFGNMMQAAKAVNTTNKLINGDLFGGGSSSEGAPSTSAISAPTAPADIVGGSADPAAAFGTSSSLGSLTAADASALGSAGAGMGSTVGALGGAAGAGMGAADVAALGSAGAGVGSSIGALAADAAPLLMFAASGGQANKVDAMVSDGEQYLGPEVMGALGNGNPDAGADKMDGIISNIRQQTKTQQGALASIPQSGLIQGGGDGRSDDVPAKLPVNSYIVPADIVSSVGKGSSLAGGKQLDRWAQEVRSGQSKVLGALPKPHK